jgi:Cu-processing system permease protein
MEKIFAVSSVVLKELYRRKDAYVLLIITVLICLVMGSVNVFNEGKVIRYLKELSLLLIWICSLIIAITTTARQIPMERENRTLFPLLAKPLTRTELLLGKFLGCWLASGAALICFYLLFGVLAASREHDWRIVSYIQALSLHWVMLAVVIAFTLLGSIIFAAPSSNTTITFVLVAFIMVLGRHLNKVALTLGEPVSTILSAIYYSIPHLEFFDVRDLIIHNWQPINWGVCAAGVIYAVAYTAVFLTIACLAFRRRAIN